MNNSRLAEIIVIMRVQKTKITFLLTQKSFVPMALKSFFSLLLKNLDSTFLHHHHFLNNALGIWKLEIGFSIHNGKSCRERYLQIKLLLLLLHSAIKMHCQRIRFMHAAEEEFFWNVFRTYSESQIWLALGPSKFGTIAWIEIIVSKVLEGRKG